MQKCWTLLVLALLMCASATWAVRQPTGPVKHYVVLMMENRAYDHLLGYFQMDGFHLNGLTGNETNPWDPSNPFSSRIRVNPHAKDISPNPDHSVAGTTQQIFGMTKPSSNAKPKMDGFVINSRHALGDTVAPRIMECWDAAHLPVITTLAKNFILFDEWHASIPGPTFGNRMYFHAATSDGSCQNEIPADGYHAKTIYQLLDEAGYDWAFYFDQAQDASFFNYTRQPKFASRMHKLKTFGDHAASGDLPTLSFLMPRFFGKPDVMADDQHPSHAVSLGEELIRTIYQQLRNSPSWDKSAFLLTYDEHGGFYDHVHPPMDVPNPDGKNCVKPVHFDFKRLGLRIPTVLISPWVDHTVVHEPKDKPTPTSKFEHSSFIATLTRQLGLAKDLTHRSAWAAPFDYLFTRTTPRTDCPSTLPPADRQLLIEYMANRANSPEHLQPLDELHISYIQAANGMMGLDPNTNLENLRTEYDGAQYLESLMLQWRQRAQAL